MANFIVSYDLNGTTPSHKQIDELLAKAGAARGRILETVWYIGWPGISSGHLLETLKPLFSSNDLLLVVEAKDAAWTKLLVEDDALRAAWSQNR